jgi:lipopolysaccharide/colanic/teichoic acid biosynthesis glycosyltransferase
MSLVVLPIVLPIIIVFSIIVKLDGGSAFYCGSRIGRNGRIFKMFKLRSMNIDSPDIRNADGSTYNSNDDGRVTGIGKLMRKTSIDELPQLFNILLGDMSFIGPRPDLPEQLNKYTEFELAKLKVRPGLSGYSQAYYRNSITASGKFQNDVFYVNNLSPMLDVKIIFVTLFNILLRKNIYNDSKGNYEIENRL